jgi:hypothetical protein
MSLHTFLSTPLKILQCSVGCTQHCQAVQDTMLLQGMLCDLLTVQSQEVKSTPTPGCCWPTSPIGQPSQAVLEGKAGMHMCARKPVGFVFCRTVDTTVHLGSSVNVPVCLHKPPAKTPPSSSLPLLSTTAHSAGTLKTQSKPPDVGGSCL